MGLINYSVSSFLLKKTLLVVLLSPMLFFINCQKAPSANKQTNDTTSIAGGNPAALKAMFGVNMYEWNVLGPADGTIINEPAFTQLQTFSGIRHYMDWQKLEFTQGSFTYNPTH